MPSFSSIFGPSVPSITYSSPSTKTKTTPPIQQDDSPSMSSVSLLSHNSSPHLNKLLPIKTPTTPSKAPTIHPSTQSKSSVELAKTDEAIMESYRAHRDAALKASKSLQNELEAKRKKKKRKNPMPIKNTPPVKMVWFLENENDCDFFSDMDESTISYV